jgi:hypothetical protein
MIDKAQQLAQSLGNRLTRRNFLGGVGRGAALAALACGGLLAVPEHAFAGRPCLLKDGSTRACPPGQACGTDGRCHKTKQPPSK